VKEGSEAHTAPTAKAPILVTGMPRSGTTWVSTMLAAGGDVVRVNEPLNPSHPPGRSPGILNATVEHRFQYLHEANEDVFVRAYRDLLQLKFRPVVELRANHQPRDVARTLWYTYVFLRGRVRKSRVLLADPYAVFSARWFVERLGARVVVIVRHPAAAVSSRKRLGWTFDASELLAQKELLRDYLHGMRAELEAQLEDRHDIIGQGALLWRAIYGSVENFENHPEVTVVRHEDLSADPLSAFQRLFAALGLPWRRRAERTIIASTSAENRKELPPDSPHGTRLDSRANISNWKHRLTPAEIERIRALTGDVAPRYYRDDEWV
jgi:Sulfotransferase family